MSLNMSKVDLLKQLEFDDIKDLDKKQIKRLIKETKIHEYLDDIFSKVEDKVIDIEEIQSLKLNEELLKIVNVYLETNGYTIFDDNQLEEIEEDIEEPKLIDENYSVMTDDIVRDYILSIKENIVLTKEEEVDLFLRYNNGEKELYNKILNSNLKLVVSIAKRYVFSDVPFMDLIQEGNIGLMKAIDRFDATRGYKFSTYATWWIRQSITRSIADNGRTIRIPVHMYEKIEKVRIIRNDFYNKISRFPTIDEISEITGFTEKQIEEILRFQETPTSLETPIGEMQHGEQSILMDFIEAENNTEKEVFNTKLREDIFAILGEIPERERQIILYRYGLEDGNPRTLEQIGQIYGITRERIRQIEAKAFRRLRNPARAKKLEDYYRK